jgi:hypothetical protein
MCPCASRYSRPFRLFASERGSCASDREDERSCPRRRAKISTLSRRHSRACGNCSVPLRVRSNRSGCARASFHCCPRGGRVCPSSCCLIAQPCCSSKSESFEGRAVPSDFGLSIVNCLADMRKWCWKSPSPVHSSSAFRLRAAAVAGKSGNPVFRCHLFPLPLAPSWHSLA